MSTNNGETERAEREDIEMLLPWYETGTLDAAEMERVTGYLRRHPEMSDQLAMIRDDREATITGNEALGAPGSGALDRLLASIGPEADPALTTSEAGGGWIARLFGATLPVGVRWAAAAAIFLIMAQAVTVGVLLTSAPDDGKILLSPKQQPLSKGTYALVGFAEDASAARITALLLEFEAVIVDGPKPGGLYKVRLAPNILTEDERDALLQRLRAKSALITLAMPAN